MGAGAYNRRVTIEAMTPSADDSGGQTESWASTGSGAWVKATPSGGSEAVAAGALQASQAWQLETWYRTDITTAHRLNAAWLPTDHRIFIDSVADPDGRRERLVISGTASLAFDQ